MLVPTIRDGPRSGSSGMGPLAAHFFPSLPLFINVLCAAPLKREDVGKSHVKVATKVMLQLKSTAPWRGTTDDTETNFAASFAGICQIGRPHSYLTPCSSPLRRSGLARSACHALEFFSSDVTSFVSPRSVDRRRVSSNSGQDAHSPEVPRHC